MARRRSPVSAIGMAIRAYLYFEVDNSLGLEDHVQSVRKLWVATENAGFKLEIDKPLDISWIY